VTAGRGYVVAVLLGLAAATLVFWQLESSASTACFRESVRIADSGNTEVLQGCESNTFDAVRRALEAQRSSAASDEPSALEAKSALIVWMALFAATAGFAAIVAVRSLVIGNELKPRWNAGLVARCAGAALLVALPFVLFRLTPSGLSDFDDLHGPQLKWIPPLIGFLMLPALICLVVIWHILSVRPDLDLHDVARLGSRIRLLVSMIGAILALGILTTAARWQAIATVPGGEAVPSIVILLWGSIFALVLAAVYVPVNQRWAAETTRLISDEVKRQLADREPLRGTMGFRSSELSLTKELHAALGVGGALKSLQGSLAVLAPVVAAAVSSLFA
jgi:hypothetical protein